MNIARSKQVTRWILGRRRSFDYAARGLRLLLDESNARIHLIATVAVVITGLHLQLPRSDWLVVIVAIVGVWVAEALNTAVEALANAAIPDIHPLVRNAKDVAAGGVLLAAIGAATMGALVFVPRLSELMR